MYDTAKKAREAMKSKARRLAGAKDQKVDSSDWTPAEPINADIKTGLRPISRRAYKSGGKVMGEACAPRMDKKPRKSGGKAMAKKMAEEKSEAAEYAKAKINRNVKAANEDREGIKHVGGMKKGGRAKKANGGSDMVDPDTRRRIEEGYKTPTQMPKNPPMPPRRPAEPVGAKGTEPVGLDKDQVERLEKGRKHGGRSKHASGGATTLAGQEKIEKYQRNLSKPSRGKAKNYKKGGPVAAADEMMRSAAETSGVPSATLGFTGVRKGLLSPLRGLKNGGKAKKADGGMLAGLAGGLVPGLAMSAMRDKDKDKKDGMKRGGRPGKFYGGAMGNGMPQLPPQASPQAMSAMGGGMPASMPTMPTLPAQAISAAAPMAQGRPFRKAGGRAKSGKGGTKINIMIAAGKPAGPADMMAAPAGPMGGIPPGLPVPLPGDGGGAAPPPMPMPMPMPMPAGGAPAMGAPAGLPLPRKSGGRITKVAKSYKDMEAGSGGGEGRLQKTDIAKTGKGAPTYKRGGKVYRSYKDMGAGAGSGEGRLQKTEIESKKH